MNSRTIHLRVKIKSLAEEARIIRKEEKKALKLSPRTGDNGYCPTYESLRTHRKGVVGYEARHSLLAYGFLRGMPYAYMEQRLKDITWDQPEFSRVKHLAERFSQGYVPRSQLDSKYQPLANRAKVFWSEFDEHWKAWEAEAEAHLKSQ